MDTLHVKGVVTLSSIRRRRLRMPQKHAIRETDHLHSFYRRHTGEKKIPSYWLFCRLLLTVATLKYITTIHN
jgi:hypothetical protein